jgi:hypothetical protein
MLVLPREGFTEYFVEMVSDGMAHIPSFTSNALGVQAILRVLSQQF